MSTQFITVQARTAASFTASIGVDIHPPFVGTPFEDESLWLPQLEAAGFEHVRTNWDENHPEADAQVEKLAAAGIKVLITSDALYRQGESAQSLVDYLVAHPQLAASITQIAGPNEVNVNFSDWATGIAPFMKALYTAIKANPVTAHILIVAPNFDIMPYDQSLAAQIGDISQYVDEGDIHGTNGGDAPNDAYYAATKQTATIMSGTKPLVNTEGGYSHGTDAANGLAVELPDDAIQIDVLRYYFDGFAAGIQSSDLYQMMRVVPGDTTWSDDFYVVNDDGTPTPVYNEIKAMTTLLHDSGTPPEIPGSLSYSLDGADGDTKSFLLQKSDGSFWLAYWEDKQTYEYNVADADKGYTGVTPTALNLRLASAATLALFNPYSGSTAPVTTSANATSILLSASTIPQLVEIQPTSDEAACYLPDTQILTPFGEVAVQNLMIGDLVLTHRGEARSIRWIGRGGILATPGRRGAATPVIVRRGALGKNVPDRDLHITKSHALYLEGALIPVELLINHRSIVWDDSAREVTVYHIELEVHDVLVANGAHAESYREDGNRWLFQNCDAQYPAQPPCAPLLTEGPALDAIWRRLLDRSGPPALALTTDPALHLLVDGQRVEACLIQNGKHAFRLTSLPSEVRIVSRACAPDKIGLARDLRVLGVALRRIVLWRGSQCINIEADHPMLCDGFHMFEPTNNFRWTDGHAALPNAILAGITGVDLYIVSACQYPLLPEADRLAA